VAREGTSSRETADQRRADQGRADQPSDEVRLGNRLLHLAEDIINAGIAVLLVAGGIVLLFEAARIGVTGVRDDISLAMIEMLDTLLLVFIFAELLFAVRTIITERTIIAEPFLLVGIIASIKEILVLSVKAAELLGDGPQFARAMTEVGILGGLVVLLAAATLVLRRKEREPEE
jgi:Phosphate-starvation-inducible E family